MAGQMQAQGQQEAFQAALSANQQQYQDVLAGRQSYMGVGPQLSQGQNQLAIQQGEAVTQANLANAQMGNAYNLGNSGIQNQYNLQAGEYPNQFNLQNYQNQLASYQAQQGIFGNLFGGAGQIFSGGLGAANTAGNLGWQPFGGGGGGGGGIGSSLGGLGSLGGSLGGITNPIGSGISSGIGNIVGDFGASMGDPLAATAMIG